MADKRPHLRIAGAIVCDDIRREVNNKEIYIGVYGERMVLPAVGVTLHLAVSLLIETLETGTIPMNMQIEQPDSQKLLVHGEVTVTEAVKPGQLNTMSVTGLPVTVTQTGDITISVQQHDEDWQVVRLLPVFTGPLPAAIPVPNASSIARGQQS